MSRNNMSFENMFGKVVKQTQSQPATPVQEQAPVVEVPVEEQALQGKLAKQVKQGKGSEPKVYNYGKKHTFPIPDDLWDDALIVMRLMGYTQVEYIQSLIRASIDANQDAVNTAKRMKGTLQ